MSIFWCKNISCTRYKVMLLTEKGRSDHDMVFMNYIAALTFTKKILLLQFLNDCGMKMRPSKTKILIQKYISIRPNSIIYYHQKNKKRFLWHKSHWGSWSSWESSVIGVSLASLVFEYSLRFWAVGSSLGSSVIVFSLGFQW